MNSRKRNRGLSVKEIILHRDQNTGKKLPFDDKDLSLLQGKLRIQNHPASSKSNARGGPKAKVAAIVVGDLVFLKSEGTKFNPIAYGIL